MIHKGENYSVKLQKYFLQRNHFKYHLTFNKIISPTKCFHLKEMMIERGIQVDHSTIMGSVAKNLVVLQQ